MSAYDEFREEFRTLLELRVARDIAQTAIDKAKKEYREKEAELYNALKEAGIRGRLEFDFGEDLGVAKFQRRTTTYGRVLDMETAVEALKAEGHEEIVNRETVREGRLNEFVRTQLEAKKPLPDGVDFYDREGISISRK